MNKRLVWNFELEPTTSLHIPANALACAAEMRWEMRCFWPEDAIICLKGLTEHFLELSQFQLKKREDTYYLLDNAPLNIKMRRGQIVYKPLLAKKEHAMAYGRKIILDEQGAAATLPGAENITVEELLGQIKASGKKIAVSKDAFVYKFSTEPATKLELARLCVQDKIYFSLSIESRALSLVETFAQHLLATWISCDYVTFLKSILV